jgi:hypothetical protein
VTPQSMFTLPEMAPDPEPAAGADETAEPLTVVPELAGGSGSDGPAPGSELVPARRTGFAEGLLPLLRQRMALIADYQRRHRTFWHAVTVFLTRPPETWAETEGHLKSGKWLQPWMTGKFRTFCELENLAWGHLVSMPAKAVLQNTEKVFFERQLGFWLGLVSIGLGVLIWLATS